MARKDVAKYLEIMGYPPGLEVPWNTPAHTQATRVRGGAWAGHIEIAVMADNYRICIQVHTPHMPPRYFGARYHDENGTSSILWANHHFWPAQELMTPPPKPYHLLDLLQNAHPWIPLGGAIIPRIKEGEV